MFGKVIKACVPMHTFGHPCRISEIKEICERYNVRLIEDATESLGSFYIEKHTGTYGSMGILSINGNKIICFRIAIFYDRCCHYFKTY